MSSDSSQSISDKDRDEAAMWLARRDRGLTAEEQDAHLQWLMESESRGAAMAELDRTWGRLDLLRQWRPAHSAEPNADLLDTRRPRHTSWVWTSLAAAAVMAFAALLGWRAWQTDADHGAQILPGPERMALEDGSLVELNSGARVAVSFTPQERRVRLEQGEAHFTVAKNPARPFIVEVDGYAVRAVGTAFLVQRGRAEVAVVVTEGQVRMSLASAAGGSRADGSALAGVDVLADLRAGQRAAATRGELSEAPHVSISDLTPMEIEAAMPWRGIRLEFDDQPLHEVVKAFNRYSTRPLVIADAATGEIRLGGSFRADNLASFLRLLETGFGVTAEVREDEIVLRAR